jgi:hypothetical protein
VSGGKERPQNLRQATRTRNGLALFYGPFFPRITATSVLKRGTTRINPNRIVSHTRNALMTRVLSIDLATIMPTALARTAAMTISRIASFESLDLDFARGGRRAGSVSIVPPAASFSPFATYTKLDVTCSE